jgi:hypothetical protein
MNELRALIEANNSGVRRMEQVSPILCRWFDNTLNSLHSVLPSSAGGLLMGCPVWGQAYLERMVRYSLPTLGTERNIAALAGRTVMMFYCLPHERPRLWEATRWLRQSGVHTLFPLIDQDVFAALQAQPEDKYGLLACVQNLLAHMAGHAGMGLHMYMPDHVYCDGYFEALARLGGKWPAVIQQGMSVRVEQMAPALEAFRDPETSAISIGAKDLGALAFKHIHPRTGRTIRNGAAFPGEWPTSHQVSWVGREHLHIASSPQNLAWISPQLCLDAPIAFTSTLDMLPPEYAPPGEWTMPGPDDGLVFCELSSDKNLPPPGFGTLDQFILRYWQQVAFTDDYQEYFKHRALTPIGEQAGYLSDDDIEAQHRWIIETVESRRHEMMECFFASQHPSRWAGR